MKSGLFLNLSDLPPVFFVQHEFIGKQGLSTGIMLLNKNKVEIGNLVVVKERPVLLEDLNARLDFYEQISNVTSND